MLARFLLWERAPVFWMFPQRRPEAFSTARFRKYCLYDVLLLHVLRMSRMPSVLEACPRLELREKKGESGRLICVCSSLGG